MNSSTRKNALLNTLLICILLFVSPLTGTPQRTTPRTWIATWTTSPEPADGNPNRPLLKIDNQTVRERVRVSAGGSQIRLRLSNEYGSSPLTIGPVTVASTIDFASIKPGSTRAVTFAGSNSITIPAGAPALSDPINFLVTTGTELTISIYFPRRVATPTLHSLALKRAVISQSGDHTRDEKLEGFTTKSSILVSAVLVPAQPLQKVIVAFGDSITDGDGSTVDADANWLGHMVRRLAKTPAASKIAVVNQGIAGNRLLRDAPLEFSSFGNSGVARFDRDALGISGVTHILLLEGINDIGFPGAKVGEKYLADPADARTVEDLIDGYDQLIARARARGVKVIGATITPCEGVNFPGYQTESKEATRQAINKWIRTSGMFDGVIDFDAVLRDPDHPSRLLAKFASGDHLHPNDVGYKAMSDAIDLTLFK